MNSIEFTNEFNNIALWDIESLELDRRPLGPSALVAFYLILGTLYPTIYTWSRNVRLRSVRLSAVYQLISYISIFISHFLSVYAGHYVYVWDRQWLSIDWSVGSSSEPEEHVPLWQRAHARNFSRFPFIGGSLITNLLYFETNRYPAWCDIQKLLNFLRKAFVTRESTSI